MKTSLLCGACIALCTALNSTFASLGTSSQFYIPIFICLLVCPAPYALVCALASPLISTVVCGQPILPLLPGMLADGLVFTLTSLLFFRLFHGNRKNSELIVTLICASSLGRLSAGLLNAVFFTDGANATAFWTAGSLLRAVPDILVLSVVSVEVQNFLNNCGLTREKPNSENKC